MQVPGEVKRVGNHQLPAVEAGGLDEGQRPYPLHHCIGLWRHLQNKDGIFFNRSIWIDKIGLENLKYFAKPVGVRDGDVVGAEVSAAPVPVEKRSQVREIAVEVDVLGVRPPIGPTVQQVTL